MGTETKNETTKSQNTEQPVGCSEIIGMIALTIMGIFLVIFFVHHHYYYAEINGAKIRFDDYPSKKDSAYVNICINIIKDVAGTDCNIKTIDYDRGTMYSLYHDPIITVNLKYNGRTQKFKYVTLDFIKYIKFPISFGHIPKYIENRIKAYPEFVVEKTDYGYTTQKSSIYYRESINWKSTGKMYCFDNDGNRIESPVPEWSKAS